MDDRELLELAAKAAGYPVARVADDGRGLMLCGVPDVWNPLADEGDALRLAVELGISITPYPIYDSEGRHSVIAKQRRHSDKLRENNTTEVIELYGKDPNAATRRAIVRSSAEIARVMP